MNFFSPDFRDSSQSKDEFAQIYNRMVQRLGELDPNWNLKPEDPASVLLEIWAEEIATMKDQLRAAEEEVIERLLELVGVEPSSPRSARCFVRFQPTTEGSRAKKWNAGTAFEAEYDDGRVAHYELPQSLWVSSGRLVRAYSTRRASLKRLPVDRQGSPVNPLLGDSIEVGRLLYLGDQRFQSLSNSYRPISIEWAGTHPELSDRIWEYRTPEGWRELPCDFELVQTPSATRLKMVLQGPLSGLDSYSFQGAKIPWIRAHLPARRSIQLSLPQLDLGGTPTSIERLFVESGGKFEDLSFSEQSITLDEPPAIHDPATYFGFDHEGPYSLWVNLKTDEMASSLLSHHDRQPRWIWEAFTSSGWTTLEKQDVIDSTEGYQRSGCISIEPPQSSSRQSLFGDRLFWLRARWLEGQYLDLPMIQSISSNSLELVEGQTTPRVRLQVSTSSEDWIPLPDSIQGCEVGLDSIRVRLQDREWNLQKLDNEESRQSKTGFFLKRFPDGKLHFQLELGESFSMTSPQLMEVDLLNLKYSLGAKGNGKIKSIKPLDSGEGGVEIQVSEVASGGLDVESIDSLKRRASLASVHGECWVTENDILRQVRGLLPQVERVYLENVNSSIRVQLIQSDRAKSQLVQSSHCLSLERYLNDHSPPGMRIEVRSQRAFPVKLIVHAKGVWKGKELSKLDSLLSQSLTQTTLRALNSQVDIEPNSLVNDGVFLDVTSVSEGKIEDDVRRSLASDPQFKNIEIQKVQFGLEGLDLTEKFVNKSSFNPIFSIQEIQWVNPDATESSGRAV